MSQTASFPWTIQPGHIPRPRCLLLHLHHTASSGRPSYLKSLDIPWSMKYQAGLTQCYVQLLCINKETKSTWPSWFRIPIMLCKQQPLSMSFHGQGSGIIVKVNVEVYNLVSRAKRYWPDFTQLPPTHRTCSFISHLNSPGRIQPGCHFQHRELFKHTSLHCPVRYPLTQTWVETVHVWAKCLA